MQFLTLLLPAVLSVGSALAANITVLVGNNSTLTFSPSSVTAQAGDLINFVFVAGNHSVTQSSFPAPCSNLSTGGMDSGFQFIAPGSPNAMQYTVNVSDASAPMWFYCRQTTPKNHCQNGMVFAVNPTADKTFAAFQQSAMMSANQTTASGSSSAAPSGSASATGSSSASATSASATDAAASGSGSSSTVTETATDSASSTSSSADPSGSPNSAGSVKVGISTSVLLAGVAASLML